MPKVLCPRCGTRAIFAWSKPYCPACGWNYVEAQAALRRAVRPWPVLWLISSSLILVAFGFVGHIWRAAAGFVVGLSVVYGSLYLHGTFLLRKMSAGAPNNISQHPITVSTPSRQPAHEQQVPAEFLALLSLPRPRTVRYKTRVKIIAALVVTFVALMVWAQFFTFAQKLGQSPGRYAVVVAPFLLLLLIVAITFALKRATGNEMHNRRLLTDGDVVIGRVVSQRTVRAGKSQYSQIEYEFQTVSGECLRGRCTDFSRKFYEDMSLPVFCNPANPAEFVPICGTTYEVVVPRV